MTIDNIRERLKRELSDIIYLEKESLNILNKLGGYCKTKKLKKTVKAQIITITANLSELETLDILENDADANEHSALTIIANSPLKYAEHENVNDIGIFSSLQRLNAYKAAIYKSVVPMAAVLKLSTVSYILQNITNNTYNINDRYERLLEANYNKLTIINL